MFKKCAILGFLLLMLIPLAVVQADSMEKAVLCGDLSEADCAILVNSQAVMDDVHSFAFALSMSMDTQGENPSENFRMTVAGTGGLSFDPAMMSEISDMEEQAISDMATMMTMIETVLGGVTGETSLDITLVADGETTEIPLDLVMKDSVVAFSFAAPEAGSDASASVMGWLSIDLAGFADILQLDSDMASDKASGMDTAAMAAMDYSELAQAFTITRLPDSQVDGVSVAVFQTALDYAKLLEIFDVAGMIANIPAGAGVDTAVIDALDAATVQVVEYIGLADFYTHRLEVAMMSNSLSLTMSINLSDFNMPLEVEIPEDVMVLPLAMMLQTES